MSVVVTWAWRVGFVLASLLSGVVLGAVAGFFLDVSLVDHHPHAMAGFGGILFGAPAGLILSAGFASAVLLRMESRRLWRPTLALVLGTLLVLVGTVVTVSAARLW